MFSLNVQYLAGKSGVCLSFHLYGRVHHEDHRPRLLPAPERLPQERVEHPRLHHRDHRGRLHHHVHPRDRAAGREGVTSFSSSPTSEVGVRGAQFTGKKFVKL